MVAPTTRSGRRRAIAPTPRSGRVESTAAQLKSIQLFAAGAPVILAGTRKDEVDGGSTATIRSLSARLHETLLRRCAPAIGGLKMCDGLCFFAVENKRGYGGDETIRQLKKELAIQKQAIQNLQEVRRHQLSTRRLTTLGGTTAIAFALINLWKIFPITEVINNSSIYLNAILLLIGLVMLLRK